MKRSNAALQSLDLKRIRRLSKEFGWILLGQGMAVLGGLVGVRLLTEFLAPVEYGKLALGMTIALLVNQLVFGPLSNGATRFFAPAREAGDLASYLAQIKRSMVLASVAVVGLTVPVSFGLFILGKFSWFPLVLISLGFALFSGYNSVLNGIQNAARQRTIVAWHQGLASWGRFLMAVTLILIVGGGSVAAIGGYGIAMAAILVSQLIFLRRILPDHDSSPGPEERWQSSIWEYSWPFAAWGIFSWAQLASDRWALEVFATTREVGFYAVLYQLGFYPISLLTSLFVRLVSPVFFERVGDAADPDRVSSTSRLNGVLALISLALASAGFLLLLPLHRLVFRVFVADEYAMISHLLPWIVLSGGVFASAQVLSLDWMSKLRTRQLIVPKMVTAVLAVILLFAGARLFQIEGVIAANLVFAVTYWIWIYLRNGRGAREDLIQT